MYQALFFFLYFSSSPFPPKKEKKRCLITGYCPLTSICPRRTMYSHFYNVYCNPDRCIELRNFLFMDVPPSPHSSFLFLIAHQGVCQLHRVMLLYIQSFCKQTPSGSRTKNSVTGASRLREWSSLKEQCPGLLTQNL